VNSCGEDEQLREGLTFAGRVTRDREDELRKEKVRRENGKVEHRGAGRLSIERKGEQRLGGQENKGEGGAGGLRRVSRETGKVEQEAERISKGREGSAVSGKSEQGEREE
jgi:hypothetical protein